MPAAPRPSRRPNGGTGRCRSAPCRCGCPTHRQNPARCPESQGPTQLRDLVGATRQEAPAREDLPMGRIVAQDRRCLQGRLECHRDHEDIAPHPLAQNILNLAQVLGHQRAGISTTGIEEVQQHCLVTNKIVVKILDAAGVVEHLHLGNDPAGALCVRPQRSSRSDHLAPRTAAASSTTESRSANLSPPNIRLVLIQLVSMRIPLVLTT